MADVKLEVCIDSVQSAVVAESSGASRVELCANLLEGGTTPSAGTIAVVRRKVKIGLMVIIRPRGGDFCYSVDELSVMKQDIEVAKALGADGVVLGVLKEDGRVDVKRTKELVDFAQPLQVTFHRAFDMTRDPMEALEDICLTGASRILTSGQEQTAYQGLKLISKLNAAANGRIIIMPGGGINESNITQIVKQAAVTECHASGRTTYPSRMTFRKEGLSMGRTNSEYQYRFADHKRLQEMLAKIRTVSQ